MKKYILLFAAFLISIASWAQKDVTTFLGIPVDGFKNEMKKKLIQKGFTYDSTHDLLEGEFNGYPVGVSIVTNNNKVYRIMLIDKNPFSEISIKIRFNNLCQQFENNKRYSGFNKQIPEDEDISYEMTVNKKRYEAVYHQGFIEELIDTVIIRNKANEIISKKYTEEQLANPTEDISNDSQSIYEKTAMDYIFETTKNKTVWFMIGELRGKYFIIMYYDNEYNKANGEDL